MNSAILMSKKWEPALFTIVSICIFSFLFAVNLNIPFIAEDYALMTYNHYESPETFSQFFIDVYLRVNRQMTGWNVRLGEQISIFFGSLNFRVFQILNPICTMFFFYLTYIYAFAGKRKFISFHGGISILIAFSMTILFQPVLGEIFFWRTGSSNFLWSLCILLTAGIPIRFLFNEENVFSKRKILAVFHTILCFFAGFTNENTVIVIWMFYLLTILLHVFYKKRKFFLWLVTSFLSLTSGLVYMLFAPSTQFRITYYNNVYGIENIGIQDYLKRLVNIILRFGYFEFGLLLFFITILVIYFQTNKKYIQISFSMLKRGELNLLMQNVIFFITSLLSLAALLFSPYVAARAFFMMNFSIITFTIYIVSDFMLTNKWKMKYGKIFIAVLLVITTFMGIMIFKTYYDYSAFVKHQEKALLRQIEDGASPIVYKLYNRPNDRIMSPSEHFTIEWPYLKGYYGIEEILYE